MNPGPSAAGARVGSRLNALLANPEFWLRQIGGAERSLTPQHTFIISRNFEMHLAEWLSFSPSRVGCKPLLNALSRLTDTSPLFPSFRIPSLIKRPEEWKRIGNVLELFWFLANMSWRSIDFTSQGNWTGTVSELV